MDITRQSLKSKHVFMSYFKISSLKINKEAEIVNRSDRSQLGLFKIYTKVRLGESSNHPVAELVDDVRRRGEYQVVDMNPGKGCQRPERSDDLLQDELQTSG